MTRKTNVIYFPSFTFYPTELAGYKPRIRMDTKLQSEHNVKYGNIKMQLIITHGLSSSLLKHSLPTFFVE